MADTKLSALNTGTVPTYYYGIQSTTPKKFHSPVILNVKDFGAVGDGSSNDTTYIQDAVAAAFAAGIDTNEVDHGAIIFFPPGSYKVDASIAFAAGNASIRIEGSGRYCTSIFADNLVGYVIDKPNNGQQNLESIRSIRVANGRLQVDSGAIRFVAAQTGVIDDCVIQGFLGVDATTATYCTRISNSIFTCSASAGTPGTMGLAMGQVGVYNCRFQGFETAISAYNSGAIISGCASEVCNIGMWLGGHRANSQVTVTNANPAVFTWTGVGGSGGDAGQNAYVLADGNYVILASTSTLPSNFVIGRGYFVVSSDHDAKTFSLAATSGGSPINAGSAGSGTHTVAALVSDALSGFAVTGFQTERCDTGIIAYSVTGGLIAGCTLTGTVGVHRPISSMTWSSGSGGVATCNTVVAHGFSVGHIITIESVGSSGPGSYNVNEVAIGTVPNATSFTYALATDPGTWDSNNPGAYSRECQYGLRVRTSTGVVYSGIQFGVDAEVAQVDLYFDGSTSGDSNVMNGLKAGTWIMPPGPSKASYKYVNCYAVNETMLFADLPTATPSSPNYQPRALGQRYHISNGTHTGGFRDNVTDGGGGGAACEVRWNGSNWQLVG